MQMPAGTDTTNDMNLKHATLKWETILYTAYSKDVKRLIVMGKLLLAV